MLLLVFFCYFFKFTFLMHSKLLLKLIPSHIPVISDTVLLYYFVSTGICYLLLSKQITTNVASRTNSCLLHHSSVGQKSVFHVTWLILCFVLYKVELKVAARQFPSWRLWGWTHVQAHSGHWQEVLCCCRSELPVPSLEWFSASRGHPHPLSPFLHI